MANVPTKSNAPAASTASRYVAGTPSDALPQAGAPTIAEASPKPEKPKKVVPTLRAMLKVLATFEGIRDEALKTEGMTEELVLLNFHIRLLKNRMKPFAKVTVVYSEE